MRASPRGAPPWIEVLFNSSPKCEILRLSEGSSKADGKIHHPLLTDRIFKGSGVLRWGTSAFLIKEKPVHWTGLSVCAADFLGRRPRPDRHELRSDHVAVDVGQLRIDRRPRVRQASRAHLVHQTISARAHEEDRA